ncbi:hypothetical protein LXJ59_28555, partial [Escherichia coli]|nr:hypothetical protein [Escherichia coli]
ARGHHGIAENGRDRVGERLGRTGGFEFAGSADAVEHGRHRRRSFYHMGERPGTRKVAPAQAAAGIHCSTSSPSRRHDWQEVES